MIRCNACDCLEQVSDTERLVDLVAAHEKVLDKNNIVSIVILNSDWLESVRTHFKEKLRDSELFCAFESIAMSRFRSCYISTSEDAAS